jgi:hypothetical protein
MAALFVLVCAVPVRADVTLTFTAPATANPPPAIRPDGTQVVADTLALSAWGVWDAALSGTLTAQGFTAANGWVYTNNPPNPLVNPLPLGNNANYNVTAYAPSATATQIGGEITFTLTLGNTNQPADATLHWLQLVNSDVQVGTDEGGGKPFGYSLAGLPGYWQLDNGQLPWAAGVGPFYDSNGGPNIVPPDFEDTPSVPVSYLHFWTIPTWDVVKDGKDYLIVGTPGLSWGFAATPEPSTVTTAGVAGMIIVVFGCYRRWYAVA